MDASSFGNALRELSEAELQELATNCENAIRQQRADFEDYETLVYVERELEHRHRTRAWYRSANVAIADFL